MGSTRDAARRPAARPARDLLVEQAENDAVRSYAAEDATPQEFTTHHRLDELAAVVDALEAIARDTLASVTGEGVEPEPLDQWDHGVNPRLSLLLERLRRVLILNSRTRDLVGENERTSVAR